MSSNASGLLPRRRPPGDLEDHVVSHECSDVVVTDITHHVREPVPHSDGSVPSGAGPSTLAARDAALPNITRAASA
jgi:hypothetical protein